MLYRCTAGALLTLCGFLRARAQPVTYEVLPSETDPSITRFTTFGNWVAYNNAASPNANVFVFLPGTVNNGNGIRFDRLQLFLQTVSAAGYQVIALQYNNSPAVAQVCPQIADPSCAGAFREKRSFGDDVTQLIDDAPQESIASRLTVLLRFLAAQHPEQGWGRYLAGDEPNWGRIALGGHSQGAGMAAYMAKRREVARVVLLSGPEDFYGADRQVAPWLTMPSATPLDRWYSVRHARERQTDALARAYQALGIPPSHDRVVDLEPAVQRAGARVDQYHVSEVNSLLTPKTPDGAPAYRSVWAFLVGRSP